MSIPTNFSGGLTVDGVSVLGGGGAIPFQFGNYYFVDATNGSDGNDGRSLLSPLKTAAQAISLVTANNNDVVVLSGYASHSLTAMLTVPARTHLVGTGNIGARAAQATKLSMGVTTAITDVTAVNQSGARSSISNIKIINNNTLTQSISALKVTAEGAVLNNVNVIMPVRLDQTTVYDIIYAADSGTCTNCVFGDDVYQFSVARNVMCFGIDASTPVKDCSFINCTWKINTTTAASALIKAGGATDCVGFTNTFRNTILSAYVNANTGAVAIDAAVKMNSSTTGTLIFDANTISAGCTKISVATNSANNGVKVCAPVPTAATSGISVTAA